VYSLKEENWRERVVCHLPRVGSRPLDPGIDQKRKITGRIQLGEERYNSEKCWPILIRCLEFRKKDQKDLNFTPVLINAVFLSIVGATDKISLSLPFFQHLPGISSLFLSPTLLHLQGKSPD